MKHFIYSATVLAETRSQADQVMGERLDPDEDYGFEYTVDWSFDHEEAKPKRVYQTHLTCVCRHCNDEIALFYDPPKNICDDTIGWATERCVEPDFICPSRESSARYPDGKPHEVMDH